MPPPNYASIDISAMTGLVGAADGAAAELPYDQWGFQSILGQVDLDTSPAGGIGKVSAWLEGAIPGLKRRLALAQAAEAGKPSFQGVVQIDENDVSTLDPTTAQNLGAADAKKLQEAGASNSTIDPTLVAEIQKYQNDPYFAAGFAQSLTPEQMAQIVQDGSSQVFLHRGDGPRSTWYSQYQNLVSAMGTTVATATRNTGSLALPADTAQQWVNVFQREMGDQNFRPDQAAALGALLQYGNYSTPFLDQVSTSVYNYERSKNGDPVWGPKAGGPLSNILDPRQDDGGTTTDVMADVLDALGHNPDAAQHFFDVGNPNAATVTLKIDGKSYQVDQRLEYLITERTWSPDKSSDNGYGLGQALNAATTFYRNGDSSGRISATIASQTFALIGNKTGDGKSGGDWYALDLNSHPGWKMWDGMRTSVANMVASYAPDLMRIAGDDDSTSDSFGDGWVHASDNTFPPNGPWGAAMDRSLMANILGTLGEDQKNIDIVTTGVGVAGALRMRYALAQALQQDPNAPVKLIQGLNVDEANGASNDIAGTLAFVIDNAYKGDASNQDFQKKQAEALSKAMGIVLAAPSFAVPESAPWTGFLLDQVKDQALDKIGEGPDQDAKSTYNDTASNTQDNLQHAMLNYVLQSGYLTPAYYAKAGPGYVPPPESALLHQDGKLVQPPEFDFGSAGYQDWKAHGHNLQAWLNVNVITPFRDKFPALGAD